MRVNQDKILGFIRNSIFVLLLIYFLQGTVYSQGSIISQGSLALIMGISGIFLIITFVNRGKKNSFYNIWTILLGLNMIGFLFFTPEYGGSYFSRFKVTLFVLLIFYPFHFFSQRGLLKVKHLVWFFVLFLPVAIGQYFFAVRTIMEAAGREMENVVNNMSYLFVCLMPFVFLMKRRKLLSIAIMFLLMYFIIQGAKRGAILVGGVSLLLFMYYQIRTLEGRYKFFGFIGSLMGLGVLFMYAYNQLMSNEYILRRFSQVGEGSFSGREIIFRNLWRSWVQSGDYLNYLFGYGFASSLRLSGTGNYAHSDWLEMLSNFGLLGVVVYTLLFWVIWKTAIFSNWKTDKKILLLVVMGIWGFSSIASMSLYSLSSFLLVILFAYLIGSRETSLK